jgi:hypothetical protein
MGVRHALFPGTGIGRPAFGGAAGFPTLFSTASGVIGLVAGPSSIAFCATTELSSEAFQLAWAGGCATGSRTRSRHVCDVSSASGPLSAGTAAAGSGALARCDGSRLLTLRLLSLHRPAVSFLISPALRRVFTDLAQAPCPSRIARSLCPAFRRLSFGRPPRGNRQSNALVLIHSSNRLPLGNCDSPGLETFPGYLTRSGAVSHRPSSLSPFFAFADGARTPPEELVNPASATASLEPAYEEPGQPA